MFKFLKEKIKKWTEKVKSKETAEAKKIKEKGKIKEKSVKETKKPKPAEESKEIEKKRFDFLRKKLTQEKFESFFQELELILLQNNVALEVVEKIKLSLKEKLIGKNLSDVNLEQNLKKTIEEILINPYDIFKEIEKTLAVKRPFVIVFVGINGSGKTTTIAKIAHLLKKEKFSTCLAAADTFRAASIEQLQKHADNLGLHLIKKDYGADPASVGFDAIAYAKKHYIDVVLIDTAGRMNTKDSLMKEMEKIVRVNHPDMKIFVGESITGNDATEQARAFNQTIDLTGIILSKADVDEKGGAAISISYITKKPILFLGTGQNYDDLEVFSKEKLIKQLFG
jgi:fused signal recognition particle receptor